MLKDTIYDELPNTIEGILLRMNQELTCPICLTLFTQCTSTPCGHTYCYQCIAHSLSSLPKCPICKESISKRSLYSSDSVEAMVQEFLVLRHIYEKDSGKVLTQLPTTAYQAGPQRDLSQLYPYPSKPSTSNTTSGEPNQREQQHLSIETVGTQSDQVTVKQEQQQNEPSIPEQPNTAAPSSTEESISRAPFKQPQPTALPTEEQRMETASARDVKSEPHLYIKQEQEKQSAAFALLLRPPQSPLPQSSSTPSAQQSTKATKVAVSSSPRSETNDQFASPQTTKRSLLTSPRRPLLAQTTLTQAFESFKWKAPRSPSPPSPSSPPAQTNAIADTSSEQVMIYTVSQLENTTMSYLEELQTQGQLELVKEAHVSSKVTHFVFPAKDGQGIQSVTGAYLQALVLRKQIVHENWIHKCYQAKTMIDAAPYCTYYIGNGQACFKNGPMRARQSALCKEPPLFHGKTVYFHDSVSSKLKKQFTNLMIAGGGQVIQSEQDMTPDTIVLCQSLSKKKDSDLVAAMRSLYGRQQPPISIVWMTQSILRYELLNEQDYIVGNLDDRKMDMKSGNDNGSFFRIIVRQFLHLDSQRQDGCTDEGEWREQSINGTHIMNPRNQLVSTRQLRRIGRQRRGSYDLPDII